MRTGSETDPAPPDRGFSDFYRKHRDEVRRYAWQLAGPHADVDNITAEAWARACEAWPRIDMPRPWVYRVVTNLARKAYRESQMTCLSADPCTDHAASALWMSGAGSIPGPEWAERITDIRRGLDKLPHHQRAAVLLAYREWTPREIAEVLGCKASTARVHLHLGRAKLRRLLGEPTLQPQETPRTGLEGRTA